MRIQCSDVYKRISSGLVHGEVRVNTSKKFKVLNLEIRKSWLGEGEIL